MARWVIVKDLAATGRYSKDRDTRGLVSLPQPGKWLVLMTSIPLLTSQVDLSQVHVLPIAAVPTFPRYQHYHSNSETNWALHKIEC